MGVLNKLDLKRKLDKDDYKESLQKLQLKILGYQRRIQDSGRSVIMVFEGPDAAGKGGAIKRVTEKLDPRLIKVYGIVKPTAEEYERHYLWRFWIKLPPYGQIAVFDRSWYGRVLVERVQKFAQKEEWKRAYREINEFERQLYDDGAVILKFYVHISKDEQLKRFRERAKDPYKHWKIDSEDWRNRRNWKGYIKAAEDMFEQTSSKIAPWYLVEGNYKWFARIKILKVIAKQFEKEFGKIH
jgi:polyphosphate kinase 2 (PPK2 family)